MSDYQLPVGTPVVRFICVRCGQLTDRCTCSTETAQQVYETELKRYQELKAHLHRIELKLDRLIDFLEVP